MTNGYVFQARRGHFVGWFSFTWADTDACGSGGYWKTREAAEAALLAKQIARSA